MKKTTGSIISLILCVIITVISFSCGFTALAASKSQLEKDIAALQSQSAKLEKEIKDLKNKKAGQQAIVDAIQKKISNTQAQILRCNREIDSINGKISENKAEIDKMNNQIDDLKLQFKKRIRAIYMSGSDSSITILLGADSFSDYLQLSQLTASVSARDRAMIEDIVKEIDKINVKIAENEKLLESQVAIKETIAAQQKALEAEENEAESLLNSIASEQKDVETDNKEIEAEIAAKKKELNKIVGSSSGKNFINPNSGLAWPVPSCFSISSYYGSRWGRMHYGIDIAGGGIYGKPIVAMADGDVYIVYSSCPHRSKSPMCSCGGGYGNYVAIDHGKITISGKTSRYKAYYAHMDSVAVKNGQHVKQGQVIGYVGTTGRSTGYHLHFGILVNDSWVNPLNYFKSAG